MGLVSRHGNAPFADGEVLEGAELEADVATIYAEFNGNIENANIKTGANIAGSKLADSSIAQLQLANNSVTVAKMAAAAVPKHHVSVIASQSWTASTSLADVAGVTSASLTPGSTNDRIFMDFCATVDPSAAGDLIFGWSVDATDYDDVQTQTVAASDPSRLFFSSYCVAAPGSSLIVIKPRHKVSGTAAASITSAVFRCWILPGK